VQRHLSFFLNNLTYPRTATRLVIIELIHTLVVKFPEVVIDDYAEFLFLPLVLRLSNDSDAKCRGVIATALKQLLEKTSNNKKPGFYFADQKCTRAWKRSTFLFSLAHLLHGVVSPA